MILVTGAGGKTGQAVTRALLKRGEPVRALVKTEEQVEDLRGLGKIDFAVEDLLDSTGMEQTMEGIRGIYLIAPNVHPEEGRIGEVAIAAARKARVERFVYHSVLHPQTRQMPHHWQKLGVEEMLLESGLSFTILQPAAYMQNLLPLWDTVINEGVYRVPYGGGGVLSLVDLEDVAEVAARMLTDPGHEGAVYELAGPEPLSPEEIAQVLSGSLELEVRAESISLESWTEQARAAGMSDYSVEALVRMFRYYDRSGLRGNPRVLQWLLERSPTNLSEFVDRTMRSRP